MHSVLRFTVDWYMLSLTCLFSIIFCIGQGLATALHIAVSSGKLLMVKHLLHDSLINPLSVDKVCFQCAMFICIYIYVSTVGRYVCGVRWYVCSTLMIQYIVYPCIAWRHGVAVG